MAKLLLNVFILSGLLHLGSTDEPDLFIDCSTPDCGDRAPLSYGFIVRLYNTRDPNRTCLGSIIAHWWIIDNCEDFPRYKYEYFQSGWATPNKSQADYKITQRIQHPGYKRVDLKSDKFDASLLFATKNAIFLRSTDREIQIIPEITQAIRVNHRPHIPRKGVVLYIHDGVINKVLLKIVKSKHCNDIFKSYFDQGSQIILNELDICVNTDKKVSPDHCCVSQALVVADNILLGMMSWSTMCSKEFGVNPWVFVNLGSYSQWIYDSTGAKDDMDNLDQMT